jgi:hypothetical protein
MDKIGNIGIMIILIYLIIHIPLGKPFKNNSVLRTTGGTYDIEVCFIVTRDTDYVRKYIKDEFNQEVDNFEVAGFTIPSLEGSPIIIWLPDLTDSSVILHELFHATISIMKWADIPLSDDTEEAYAYEIQYLYSELNKHFRNENY